MANQVTDNRTDIDDGTSATSWEDISGGALAVDTEIAYDTFSGSIGQYATTTQDATMFNNGGTGLFASGDVAYLLVNCGVVSLLDAVGAAPAGLTVRVTGATATDWAEFDLLGSDQWPSAFSGGWIQIVIDIDDLLASPSRTNGTAPTVANIQRFGITFTTATVMPRMTDNIWVGGFRILGSATPAIIIEGRNGGSTDWDFASVAAVAAIQLSAVLLPGPGGSFVSRGPIQFGISDTSTHAFLDTNKILLWDTQEVTVDGFYGLSALGNSGGTTNVTLGIKSGSGDDASGSQGGVIAAGLTASRYFMDFDDPDVDGVNFYGLQMIHGGVFELDDPAVSCISCSYIDCSSAEVHNSEQLRNSVINPNTADGVAFMRTDDINDIKYCQFQFSDGHAIELDAATPTAQSNVGNSFSGFTNSVDSTDAAILNSAAGALAISSSAGSNLETSSYRNTGGGSVVITNDIQITLTGLVNDSEISVYDSGDGSELAHIEDVVGNTFAFTDSAANVVDIFIHKEDYYRADILAFTIPAGDASIPVQQRFDPNYQNP